MKYNYLSKLISLTLLSISIVLFFIVQNLDQEFTDMPSIGLSNQSKEACSNLSNQLKSQNYSFTNFKKITLYIREQRLKKNPIAMDLPKCLSTSKLSKYEAELEIFSSDYGTKAESDLNIQISIFESKSKNKVAEFGTKLN